MYAVTAYASWTDVETRTIAYHATYRERSYAMRVSSEGPWPVVDVRYIGEAGQCPMPQSSTGGHRFDVQRKPVECSDCGAWMDDLYLAGTYLPIPPRYSAADGTIGGGNDWP